MSKHDDFANAVAIDLAALCDLGLAAYRNEVELIRATALLTGDEQERLLGELLDKAGCAEYVRRFKRKHEGG